MNDMTTAPTLGADSVQINITGEPEAAKTMRDILARFLAANNALTHVNGDDVRPKKPVLPEMVESGLYSRPVPWSWGEEILVCGERPTWLRDDEHERVAAVLYASQGGETQYPNEEGVNPTMGEWEWSHIRAIILPFDHWAYRVLERGFTPWAGGPEAPADLEAGSRVLFRSGEISVFAGIEYNWAWVSQDLVNRADPEFDIIGYHRCARPATLELTDEASTDDIIDPVGPYSIGSDLWPGLSKLIEESGECAELMPAVLLARSLGRLVQLGGKVMQTGGLINHWSGDLSVMLTEEIGDLKAAIDFFTAKNRDLIDQEAVERRRFEKQAKFWRWHRENAKSREAQS